MVCTGLPPILRGVDEVVKTLRWSHDFVWAWLGTEAGGTIPAMPEMRAGKTRVFSTPLLVQWNLTFFSPAPVRREMGRSHRALRGRKEVA